MVSPGSFYVILPSNTQIDGNRTNSFRVRLPRKLQFNSEWWVGLSVIIYPHSYPSLGTSSDQYITVVWRTGERIRIPIPSKSFLNPKELRETVHKALDLGSEPLAQKVRSVQVDYIGIVQRAHDKAKAEHSRLVKEYEERKRQSQKAQEQAASSVVDVLAGEDVQGAKKILERKERYVDAKEKEAALTVISEEDLYREYLNNEIAKLSDESRNILDATKELGLEAWVHAYRRPKFSCRLDFNPDNNRFTILMDNRYVHHVEMTEQLAYILGFDKHIVSETTTGRFMPDLSGGVSNFYVYAPGLIEPVMVGDVTAPLLRIVTIRGKKDEVVEEQFFSIQYHKLLVKEISEIFLEIRTNNGAYMPFEYGVCICTLHFKKASYF